MARLNIKAYNAGRCDYLSLQIKPLINRFICKVRKYIIFLITIAISSLSYSLQAAPKRELRAAWIATVGNIDWPSKQGLSAQQQQQEFVNHISFLQQLGFNAVIVQVRPAADALYESEYEPWSRYLSGKQGQAPFPKYDPLTFMIQECHKRNMEFHAWFNPYRALVSSKSNPNPSNHVTRTHPDWIIHYDGKSYFDPGNPAAKEYILKVMLDVVKRYDIDALHIDDYFYPYPKAGLAFGDNTTYSRYNNNLDKADWRRSNFIYELNAGIKKTKSWVKFGVSPFGIWRNNNMDPEGSATRGSSCYDELYSDVRLWIQKKWVDYVAPQLYWENGHRVAAYDILLPWWKNNTPDRHLYIGLGLYRMVGAKNLPWNSPNEIIKQIQDARALKTDGFVFYSMISFYKIGPALSEILKSQTFGTIAIPPAMPWIKHTTLSTPIAQVSSAPTGNLIQWTDKDAHALRYLVYRFAPQEKIDLEKAENIIALTSQNRFLDKTADPKGVRYVITALDRLWNESNPSAAVTVNTP
jgi:uncharacterized lipoprotein YddW (UPF0748 family)